MLHKKKKQKNVLFPSSFMWSGANTAMCESRDTKVLLIIFQKLVNHKGNTKEMNV